MKFCSKCGKELSDDTSFCPECGCSANCAPSQNNSCNDFYTRYKFCSKCGNKMLEEAVICPSCGCAATEANTQKPTKANGTGLKTAAKVFMVIPCAVWALIFVIFTFASVGSCLAVGGAVHFTVLLVSLIYAIPLAWCLPMTIIYFRKCNNGENVGTGFKICSLLFVSLLAGIFMLCDKD